MKIPIKKRKINKWMTEVAKPIKKTVTARPDAEIIKMFFRPYLSPILPQIGEKKKAVTKVIPKIRPDHFWIYASDATPKV